MPAKHASLFDRLVANAVHDENTGCWPWVGPTRRHGGGHRPAICMRTPDAQHPRQFNAARVMCELFHGPAPTPQHEASHLCEEHSEDSWQCIHPWHLIWETKKENMARMWERKRREAIAHPDNDPELHAGLPADLEEIPF